MAKHSFFERHRERLLKRWMEADYPGGNPRFQLGLLGRDLAVFLLIPICAVIFFKLVEGSMSRKSKASTSRKSDVKNERQEKHSQIISFQAVATKGGGVSTSYSKRAPGTLVRVRLLNVVETFSNAPVHAQIVDANLGKEFNGATLIGDASPESGSGRVTMTFKFVRHPLKVSVAVPISARALSLDGTYGLHASKKEGFFARSAIRSATNSSGSTSSEDGSFKTLVARAVAAGLMQEFNSEASTAHNNAQVLTVKPMTEFFIELTDYFPGQK